MLGDSPYPPALGRGQSGNAGGERVLPRRNGSTCMTRIYARNSISLPA